MMANKADEYSNIVIEKIQNLVLTQKNSLEMAAEKLFSSLSQGGVWNIFGSGHSHMPVEEAFHRAGGLIPVNAWLEEYLMPHMGPGRSGPFERLTGLAQIIFDYNKPFPGEVLTVISNSGINPVGIEMAEIGKKEKLFVVAITSLEHSKNSPSRHFSGKRLYEVSDLVIDTGGVAGDAAVSINGLDVNVGPLSTILSSVVINMLSVRVCEIFSENKKKAPVYLSANVDGGDARNKILEEKYRSRIRRL